MAPLYPTTSANDTVWVTWSATTNTTAVTATQVWESWTFPQNTTGGAGINISYPPPAPLTAEQEDEQRRRAEEARRKQEERNREQEAARARARELLLGVLDRKQQRELERDGHFHVETADGRRRYRLRPGRPPIRVHGEDGRRYSYCIHPSGHWPPDDVVVAHKLLLESDEAEFLRIANATAVRA